MIALTQPRPLSPPGPLRTAGGFLWWYLDLTDAHGNGLVLIWSFGLPFLPGIARAARSGHPELPADKPAINVVIYQNGQPDLYVLQPVDPAPARWSGSTWELGGLTARMTTGSRLTLSVELDCAVPGTTDRLTGLISLVGQPRRGSGEDTAETAHEWTPLAVVAHGSAALACGERRWSLQGRAYLDRNLGQQPLHTLGISRWWWLRLALPEQELIAYHLVPTDTTRPTRSLCLRIDADGSTEASEGAGLTMSGWRPSLLGPAWPRRITLTPPDSPPLAIRLAHLVDNGPFYQRFQIEAQVDGARVRGFAEQVIPDRIDQAWSRPLVEMAVHRHDGSSSMWLPLFSGPRAGRLARLLGVRPGPARLPVGQP